MASYTVFYRCRSQVRSHRSRVLGDDTFQRPWSFDLMAVMVQVMELHCIVVVLDTFLSDTTDDRLSGPRAARRLKVRLVWVRLLNCDYRQARLQHFCTGPACCKDHADCVRSV